MYVRSNAMSVFRKTAPFSNCALTGDWLANVSASCRPNSAMSASSPRDRSIFVPGGNACAPRSCSGCTCVTTRYSAGFLLTFATSRTTASPFLGPSPVSMTSVARLPTMMPTFGTSGTSSSGIRYTCGLILVVTPSRTRGSRTCIAGPAAAIVRKASVHTMWLTCVIRGSLALQRVADDRLGFLQDSPQMIRALEAFPINLVDVLSAGRPRREPSTLSRSPSRRRWARRCPARW